MEDRSGLSGDEEEALPTVADKINARENASITFRILTGLEYPDRTAEARRFRRQRSPGSGLADNDNDAPHLLPADITPLKRD
ncbi:hypothetical protein [Roseibium sp. MMSF_3544]|uniref:hypothetical protein n=1 Tax=unclassified Roseibium TaxID=2629323 RepID=UPI0027401791|nr:hypothetical protein [Roseibium sp. MMSF_3544]